METNSKLDSIAAELNAIWNAHGLEFDEDNFKREVKLHALRYPVSIIEAAYHLKVQMLMKV